MTSYLGATRSRCPTPTCVAGSTHRPSLRLSLGKLAVCWAHQFDGDRLSENFRLPLMDISPLHILRTPLPWQACLLKCWRMSRCYTFFMAIWPPMNPTQCHTRRMLPLNLALHTVNDLRYPTSSGAQPTSITAMTPLLQCFQAGALECCARPLPMAPLSWPRCECGLRWHHIQVPRQCAPGLVHCHRVAPGIASCRLPMVPRAALLVLRLQLLPT